MVNGVQALIEKNGLDAANTVLWFGERSCPGPLHLPLAARPSRAIRNVVPPADWFCIFQDVDELKTKGVMSLIRYVTLSDYMLVPLEDDFKNDTMVYFRTNYASRAWCRIEWFIFTLWAEMHMGELPRDQLKVPLYSVQTNGSLCQYAAPRHAHAHHLSTGTIDRARNRRADTRSSRSTKKRVCPTAVS